MQRTVLSILRVLAGGMLLLAGIAGLFLPILQGWLLIFAGLLVLFPEETAAGRRIRIWIRTRRAELKNRWEDSREERRQRRRFF
jgi:hypothetical protein